MVQRRAARWTRSEYSPYASVTQMLQSPGWQFLEKRRSDSRLCLFYNIIYGLVAIDMPLYTETIKLCPLDVYVCQFLLYERISFNFLHYKLLSFKNVMVLSEIHLITNRAADKKKQRRAYIDPYFYTCSNTLKFKELLQITDQEKLMRLSKFMRTIMLKFQ